jgi:hypothetical protein
MREWMCLKEESEKWKLRGKWNKNRLIKIEENKKIWEKEQRRIGGVLNSRYMDNVFSQRLIIHTIYGGFTKPPPNNRRYLACFL